MEYNGYPFYINDIIIILLKGSIVTYGTSLAKSLFKRLYFASNPLWGKVFHGV